MQVNQLRAFLAVAEELHFGRAAERLHLAQPPVSRTIKQLEKELGTTLFDRSTRSVSLTAAGEALVPAAHDVMSSLRRAEAAVRSAEGGQVGFTRISFAGISTHRLVADLARAVRSHRPGVHLELSSQDFAQPAMRRLLQDETDIVLGRWDVVPPDVTTKVVMPDALVVALPDSHPLASGTAVSIARLRDEPFVSLPPHEGAVLDDRLRRMARSAGFIPDIAQVAPDTHTALALVGAEVGCHLTLASVADNTNDRNVAFVPLTESTPDVDLRAAWRTDDKSPALHAVLDELLDLAQPG